ncbi:hypothetical protein G7046_g8631 [Stylonectria norvegica]|nr:hypothetical protein G7046_g8631 [Stylonectria norvegica]
MPLGIPPRSGGKSFSTFTVFELVKKFYNKEIKTWTELTTRLGVEPPDPSKDESAQKIAQYGVRLKKWMNSLHVKAFFEYLMDISNDYWTLVPNDPNPIGQPMRDGVAVEDDMALRALLPHIRPKRGRKRPADDAADSAAQQAGPIPSSAVDIPRSRGPWYPQAGPVRWPSDPSKESTSMWQASEVVQTPLTRWPQSAITPTTRNTFWDDALEPRSAITPSKPKLASQRRGPKNVSSAWRPGITEGGAKTRGRPPINRTPISTTLPKFPTVTPISGPREAPAPYLPLGPDTADYPTGMHSDPSHFHPTMPVSVPLPEQQPAPQEGGRPARPSISLQVPERPSGSVRLATPPPLVMVNGESEGGSTTDHASATASYTEPAGSNSTPGEASPRPSPKPHPQPKDIPQFYFERVEERKHVDEVIGFLTRATVEAHWFDADGKPSHPPTMEEATAMVNTTVEGMYKEATSPQAFLINLAAIAGGRMLLSAPARVLRMGDFNGHAKYLIEWEYCFGSIKGQYNMEHNVPHTMLKDPSKRTDAAEGDPEKMSAGEWQAKYENLLGDLQDKDRELLKLRTRVMHSLKRDVYK